MPIHFDNPSALLLGLLAVPAVWMGWRYLTGMSTLRRSIICSLRAAVILGIAFTLAQPKFERRGEGLTVVLLLDRSESVNPELETAALEYLRVATEDRRIRRTVDQLAVVEVGAEARVERMPDRATLFDPQMPIVRRHATNLAQGLRLGLAIAPRDTATRFILVSDGNENVGQVLSVAAIARANGIPVDVLALIYDYDREVIFERIMAPSIAREGQPVTLRFLLRSTHPTTGRVTLTHNGEIVDLNPDDPESRALPVELDEGVNRPWVTLTLSEAKVHRFSAEFEPDRPEDDTIRRNNLAEAVVVVGGPGRVLVVDERPEETASLRRALLDAEITVERAAPVEVDADLLVLSAYDAIILANVPAHAFGVGVDEALRRYVHDLGGGLLMLGGEESFGNGGWINSQVSRALPVRMDPPDKTQMPRGALVCIMHSSEIPQGNYWGQQCAIAAIEALSRLDLAGVIDYDWNRGANWVFPLQVVGDKTAAIAAIRKMTMGDMPDFGASMQMALDALKSVRAGQKHVIIISDGDPSPPRQAMLNEFVQNRITISTVIAGGHGNPMDVQNMAMIARVTGGTAYNPPQNRPNEMPRIFIKEAMIVRRSLIVEGETYVLTHRPSGRPGPFTGRWSALPTIRGYVLTAPLPGYDPEVVSHLGDPVFAQWQYGLGKGVAFTSDTTTGWGHEWVDWVNFQAFWEQVVRWSMRSAAPANIQHATRLEGDRAIIEVDMLGADRGFANFGTFSGLVLGPPPELEDQPLELSQVGPGRWRGEFRVDQPGTWVANLVHEDPEGQRSAIQAAVSVPFSREYADLRDNEPLMRTLADRTDGRILPTNPRDANLFDREGLEPPRSLAEIWPLVAILVGMLFLMDVAARRLAIDPVALRRRWAELWSTRAEAGQHMDRLRQTRRDVQDRVTAHRPKREKEIAEAADRKFEAEEGAESLIDLDAESSDRGPSLKKPTVGDRGPATKGAEPADDEGGYTSRLLEAKRRAREKKPEKDK